MTMPDILIQYGVVVLFAWAFAVQAGLPIPAVPMLVGAGALSGAGHMNLVLAIGVAMLATVGADVLWYALGRSLGARALGALCRFSLDPDSLIRDAKDRFLSHRLSYVVLAKFLPGANPLAAGLAGIVSLRPERFLLYAAAGALLWGGAWITLGYLCADLLAVLVAWAAPVGRPLAVLLGAALALYIAWKYIRRHRFLRHLAAARITPMELNRRLEAGDPLVIVDLRTALDISLAPYKIPGARVIDPEELRHPHHTIPRDSEVVFYCAEPREATSARVALRAAAIGFKNVRPLSGGLEAWREAGLPVESLAPISSGPFPAERH
jgi:membrane protein DedA with SNARE-associated domain/rhodanese-related sulfurtransferase